MSSDDGKAEIIDVSPFAPVSSPSSGELRYIAEAAADGVSR